MYNYILNTTKRLNSIWLIHLTAIIIATLLIGECKSIRTRNSRNRVKKLQLFAVRSFKMKVLIVIPSPNNEEFNANYN